MKYLNRDKADCETTYTTSPAMSVAKALFAETKHPERRCPESEHKWYSGTDFVYMAKRDRHINPWEL